MLVLTNGTLIDGSGYEPIQKAKITIIGNRIEYVGSETKYLEDEKVIDLHDLTIMPGLIDCHCHLHLGGLTVD